jgi:uncharacterized repeat protein (TIGR03803 family)
MTKLSTWKTAGAVFLLCAATAIVSQAQTFNTLVQFNGSDGANPLYGALVQGIDGNLYGTTSGPQPDGTIFRITPQGVLTTIHSFTGSDGRSPYGGLVLATDGNFYGTTAFGGVLVCEVGQFNGCGTVFRITPSGELTTLYSFCTRTNCTDGTNPYAGLVEATDGNFYGTTHYGGDVTCNPPQGCGTVFKITPAGILTTLRTFEGTGDDGDLPQASLIQGTNGSLYGTTYSGGNGNIQCCGTAFRITKYDRFTSAPFGYGNGAQLAGGLIQGADGNFYGTTAFGSLKNDGTIFKITPSGRITSLYDFNGSDGAVPFAGLVQATDGDFYGTTAEGGDLACNFGCGTLFKISTSGVLTTLHDFDSSDGEVPESSLLQATNGIFYGTTPYLGGNPQGFGTVFSLDVGLGSFVAFVRNSGKVGSNCGILGQGFRGATDVSLNGISANFKVISDTFIKATVPPGATTGFVTVTTPSGTLTSNVPFRVIP